MKLEFHKIYKCEKKVLSKKTMKESYIYIVSNKNRTVLYIGISANLKKRIEEHKNHKGSIFTKKYNCNDLLYFEL